MLKIRLKRVGRKHDPSFRLVVVDSARGPKSGDYIENLGSYDARVNSKNINGERASYWLGVGAQPSDTAHNLLVDAGIIKGKKINVLPKKSPIKNEAEEAEAEVATESEGAAEATEGEEVSPETEEIAEAVTEDSTEKPSDE